MQVKTWGFLSLALLVSAGLLGRGIDMLSIAQAGDKLEHEQARELREQGKILPLQAILEKVSQKHPGQVIETELEHKAGRYLYELEIIDDKGRVMELYVDAENGKVVKIEAEE